MSGSRARRRTLLAHGGRYASDEKNLTSTTHRGRGRGERPHYQPGRPVSEPISFKQAHLSGSVARPRLGALVTGTVAVRSGLEGPA